MPNVNNDTTTELSLTASRTLKETILWVDIYIWHFRDTQSHSFSSSPIAKPFIKKQIFENEMSVKNLRLASP